MQDGAVVPLFLSPVVPVTIALVVWVEIIPVPVSNVAIYPQRPVTNGRRAAPVAVSALRGSWASAAARVLCRVRGSLPRICV